jgi:hypothetical protein
LSCDGASLFDSAPVCAVRASAQSEILVPAGRLRKIALSFAFGRPRRLNSVYLILPLDREPLLVAQIGSTEWTRTVACVTPVLPGSEQIKTQRVFLHSWYPPAAPTQTQTRCCFALALQPWIPAPTIGTFFCFSSVVRLSSTCTAIIKIPASCVDRGLRTFQRITPVRAFLNSECD